jgi:hypothetical protein
MLIMSNERSRLSFWLRSATLAGASAFVVYGSIAACSPSGGNESELSGGNGGQPGKGGSAGVAGSGGGSGGNGGTSTIGPRTDAGGGTSAKDSGGGDVVCSRAEEKAKTVPVYLVFAFDMSASMGSDIQPYYIKSQKWDPVVLATKNFFADPASAGLNASMTFFPFTPQGGNWCNWQSYQQPHVAMQPINATNAVNFANMLDTAGGTLPNNIATPTLAVVTGALNYITTQRQTAPGSYVLVLVTDGIPQMCPNIIADPIQPVVDAVRQAHDSSNVSTYVIAVDNPPGLGAPVNALTDLNSVAAAGGTDAAYIIGTSSNTTDTVTKFTAAINKVRSSTISCTLTIPKPPSGVFFDKEKIRVLYKAGGSAESELTYDAGCTKPNAWKYDNADKPTQIILCDNSCGAIKADTLAVVSVDFTCEKVITVVPVPK